MHNTNISDQDGIILYDVNWSTSSDSESSSSSKAVCALYQQQTSGKQMIMGAFCRNGRRFNKHDALR